MSAAVEVPVHWFASGSDPATALPSHEVMRTLNEGVAVFDLRGASSAHGWIARLAASVPGIVLLSAPAWHEVTAAMPGGTATRLRLLHQEHGARGLRAAHAYRARELTGADLDRDFPLAGWLARRSLAVLTDLDDPRCAVPADLHVPVHPLPCDATEVQTAVLALAREVVALRRQLAANLAADAVAAAAGQWSDSGDRASVVFERAAAAIVQLYPADV
jgi:hypothetical protein